MSSVKAAAVHLSHRVVVAAKKRNARDSAPSHLPARTEMSG